MEMAVILIRIGVSLVMISFGINQLKSPEDWIKEYMPKFIQKNPFFSPVSLMRMHAMGNIAFGVLFISGQLPQIGAIVTLLWWLSILPFAFYDSWKAGMRDLAIIASIMAVVVLVR